MTSKQKTAAQVNRAGIGFAGLLTLVFITLKLCGVINWSWLWVLSPSWLGAASFLFLFAVIAGGLAIWIFGLEPLIRKFSGK